MRFILAFVLSLLLVLAAVRHHHSRLQVGAMPPADLGKDAAGNPIHLADYRGKIVIVSFWASWCGPCQRELPVLEAIQRNGTREKIAAFAVNWQEDAERFQEIRRAMPDTDLTLVSDAKGDLGRQYGVRAIPHMVIIGRDGRVAAVHIGYGERDAAALREQINSLWNTPADPACRTGCAGPLTAMAH